MELISSEQPGHLRRRLESIAWSLLLASLTFSQSWLLARSLSSDTTELYFIFSLLDYVTQLVARLGLGHSLTYVPSAKVERGAVLAVGIHSGVLLAEDWAESAHAA